MKQKRILTDPTFWVLVALNGYLVFRFYKEKDIFVTLIFLYWSQSMLLGIFTTLDILTTRNPKPAAPEPAKVMTGLMKGEKPKISSAKFFFVAFAGLHLFYLPFLFTMKSGRAPIDWEFFKYFLYLFLAGQIISFIQHKVQQAKYPNAPTPSPFIAFIRVLPMHLTIIFASFFTGAAVGIFLILKSVADVVMYAITKPSGSSKESDAASLIAQQTQNMHRL